MPTKRKPAPANEYEADELRMHIDNTRKLYDQKRAIEMLLLRKVKAGKYSHALAPKAFLYVAEAGAKDYRREYGADDPRSFNPATRMMAAKEFVREFEGEQEFRDAGGKRVANPSRKRKSSAKRNPARSMTKEQAVREFRSIYPAGSFVGRNGRLDKPMAREAWNNFTDSLNRDRRITDAQYARWSGLPQYSDRKRR